MTAEVEGAAPAAFGNLPRGMSRTDAAAIVVITLGVAALRLVDPGEDSNFWYLLVFPIWIVARDFGVTIGLVAAAGALAVAMPLYVTQDAGHRTVGYMALAAVFAGTAAAGGAGRAAGAVWKRNKAEWLLTAKPKVVPRSEVLSRRELEVMDMIALGAKNSDIADRFVISQNTVKSHVSQILKKLSVANRTEAAYRYQELYGHAPHGAVDGSTVRDEPAEIGAASVLPATVSDLVGNDRVLLGLQDGRDLEVPVLDPIRGRLDAGTAAIVYFDGHDRAVGWYLPELDLGVDMRHWAP